MQPVNRVLTTLQLTHRVLDDFYQRKDCRRKHVE